MLVCHSLRYVLQFCSFVTLQVNINRPSCRTLTQTLPRINLCLLLPAESGLLELWTGVLEFLLIQHITENNLGCMLLIALVKMLDI